MPKDSEKKSWWQKFLDRFVELSPPKEGAESVHRLIAMSAINHCQGMDYRKLADLAADIHNALAPKLVEIENAEIDEETGDEASSC